MNGWEVEMIGACAVCGAVVDMSLDGRIADHDDADGEQCPGSGEWPEG